LSLIQDLANFLGLGSGERATKHGEVLRVRESNSTVDESLSGNHAIAVDLGFLHAKVGATMRHQLVVLHEAASVKEQFYALTCSKFVAGVLFVDARLSSAHHCIFLDLLKSLDKCLPSLRSLQPHWRLHESLAEPQRVRVSPSRLPQEHG